MVVMASCQTQTEQEQTAQVLLKLELMLLLMLAITTPIVSMMAFAARCSFACQGVPAQHVLVLQSKNGVFVSLDQDAVVSSPWLFGCEVINSIRVRSFADRAKTAMGMHSYIECMRTAVMPALPEAEHTSACPACSTEFQTLRGAHSVATKASLTRTRMLGTPAPA